MAALRKGHPHIGFHAQSLEETPLEGDARSTSLEETPWKGTRGSEVGGGGDPSLEETPLEGARPTEIPSLEETPLEGDFRY